MVSCPMRASLRHKSGSLQFCFKLTFELYVENVQLAMRGVLFVCVRLCVLLFDILLYGVLE